MDKGKYMLRYSMKSYQWSNCTFWPASPIFLVLKKIEFAK